MEQEQYSALCNILRYPLSSDVVIRSATSVIRTLELFQTERRGISERRCGAHMGFSERMDTTFNWTEL